MIDLVSPSFLIVSFEFSLPTFVSLRGSQLFVKMKPSKSNPQIRTVKALLTSLLQHKRKAEMFSTFSEYSLGRPFKKKTVFGLETFFFFEFSGT